MFDPDTHAGSASSTASPSPSHPLPQRRTKVSCFPCRTRKSKCDHARPCSSCVLRGTENQCADPSGSAPNASSSGTATPTAAPASRSRALPASTSMPGLADAAATPPSQHLDRLNGSHQKRRRTDAASLPSSSRDPDIWLTDTQRPPPASSGRHLAQHDIADEVQRMKHSLTRLEALLEHHSTQAASSASTVANLPSSSSSGAIPHGQASSPTCDYQLDLQQDLPGETDPPSKESRQRWHHLRSILPPLIDTHLLMHYLLVEGDWLMQWIYAPRFVARWRYSYERQAISDVFAVQVLTVVACSALFLSDNRQRSIQCAVPIRSLHVSLMKEAVRIIDSMPALRSGRTEAESCDMIELMLSTSFYFRCIGKELFMSRYTERACSYSLRAGFDNELRPGWLGLTQDQIERRRMLIMETVLAAKWLGFHCRRDLSHLRIQSFNVGQAHLQNLGQMPPLSAWPQSEDLARSVTASAASGARHVAAMPGPTGRFFALRTKTNAEREIARNYAYVSSSFSNELPSIVELIFKTEAKLLQPEAFVKCSKDEIRDMARQTRHNLARIHEWFDEILPRANVGFERIVNANITTDDPVEAKAMAAVLMFNHAAFYKVSILCRAWLLLADRLQSLDDAHHEDEAEYDAAGKLNQDFFSQFRQRSMYQAQHMHASWLPPTFLADIEAAVVENARRCIRTIPVIRKLQSQSSSPFCVGWLSQSFLQAAVNLAIPLVRSHQRRVHQRGSDEADDGLATARSDELRHMIVTIFEAVSQLSDNVMARRTAQVLNRAIQFGGIEQPLVPSDEDGVEDAWDINETEGRSGQMQNAAEGLALLSAASTSSGARTTSDVATSRSSGSDKGSPALATRAWEMTNSRVTQSWGPPNHGVPTARPSTSTVPTSHQHLLPFKEGTPPTPYPATTADPTYGGAGARGDDTASPSRELTWWEARLPVNTQQAASGGDGSGGLGGIGQNYISDSQLLDEVLNLDPSFWQFVVEGTNVPAHG